MQHNACFLLHFWCLRLHWAHNGPNHRRAQANAAYVLLATDAFIRLYALSNVARGKRTVIKKVKMEGRALHAATFQANNGAPGVLSLVQQDDGLKMQVRDCDCATELIFISSVNEDMEEVNIGPCRRYNAYPMVMVVVVGVVGCYARFQMKLK